MYAARAFYFRATAMHQCSVVWRLGALAFALRARSMAGPVWPLTRRGGPDQVPWRRERENEWILGTEPFARPEYEGRMFVRCDCNGCAFFEVVTLLNLEGG